MFPSTRQWALRYRRTAVRSCLACQHPPRCFSSTETPNPGNAASSPPPAAPPSSTPYEATLGNLRIGRHTRVIFQGFTGRQASANARESLVWGTNVVGGVTPGRTGEHLGLPLLPSVRAAVEALRPDATGIYVPAALAPAAIEEAIEAQVPLVVAVAEHIPLHAILRIHAMLKTQSVTRLVGANSPGIISAVGRCRIGFQPLPCFSEGRIGIAARSGTLSYEAVASTTRAGLGQSLCVGVGGDVVAGTDLREALTVLVDDPDTDAIALIGEIGGDSELQAAAWIEAYHNKAGSPKKPIVALVAGTHAVPGRIMGHAGAFTLPGEPTPREKIAALERAGVTMVDHPEKFGEALKARLAGHGSGGSLFPGQAGSTVQRRAMHTSRAAGLGSSRTRRPAPHTVVPRPQRRSIHLGEAAAFDLLRRQGINAAPYSGHGAQRYLAISIDRSAKAPCVLASPDLTGHASGSIGSLAGEDLRRFPLDYGHPYAVDGLLASRVAAHLQLDRSPATAEGVRRLLRALYTIFLEQEAFLVETSLVSRLGDIKVVQARMGLDDVAYAQRGLATAGTRTTDTEVVDDALAAEAKKGGIVYVTLKDDDGRIGTLVNGAGLAMNTVDALAGLGGKATNFLDTGGKATSETVKTCFEVLLKDPRVRVILVNVFGGLTLGDMIARGVVLAFQETRVTVPVVVRIRGTNEAEGQAIIQGSGLPLYAYDSFGDAAAKAIELAGERRWADKRM